MTLELDQASESRPAQRIDRRPPWQRAGWLGLLGLLAMAAVGGSQLFLFNSTSDVYYRFAIVAGKKVNIDKKAEVVGNVHSNDDVHLKRRGKVTGDVSAVDEVRARGTVDGTVTEGAESLGLPSILDEAELRQTADRVFERNTVFQDETLDDVVFVDGRVRICSGLNGVGTIIATRDIEVVSLAGGDSDSDSDSDRGRRRGRGSDSDSADSDSADSDSSDSDSSRGAFNCNRNTSVATLDASTRISLISRSRIRLGQDRSLRGALRAGKDVTLEEGASFEGVIVADGKVQLMKGARVDFLDLDQVPPTIELVTPAEGSFVASSTPEIVVSVTDDLSGVRPASLVVLLDGVDLSADVSVSGSLVTLTPSPLDDGEHTLEIMVTDGSENPAQASLSFTTDTTPPEVVISDPEESLVINDIAPTIIVDSSDAIAVDVDSLQVAIDGVDLTATCTGGSVRAVCESTPLAEGFHEIAVAISDRAGNTASARRSFELLLDAEPPQVTITSPLPDSLTKEPNLTVAGTAVDSDEVTRIEVNNVEAAWDGSSFVATLELDEGLNSVVVVAVDRAGNRSSEAVAVTLDSTPPTLILDAPADGQVVNAGSIGVKGEASDDSGISSVEISGTPVSWVDGRFDLSVPLSEGQNSLALRAVDGAGNVAELAFQVTRFTIPEVSISSPESLTLVTTDTVTVNGTVSDSATVTVNGVVGVVTGNSFTATGVPIADGATLIDALATAANGAQASASITVFRDQTAPRVTINTPFDGEIVSEPTLSVGGLVNDIVLGTVNSQQATVTVNGIPAAVSNRCFLAEAVPLVEGDNTITVVATDASGNVGQATVQVRREAPTGSTLRAVSGQLQAAPIGTVLTTPLVTELVDGDGNPLAGRPVIFKVVEGAGVLDGAQRRIAVTTDASGRAAATFTLGNRAGVGNQAVEALVVGVGSVLFMASALPAEPAAIHVDSGDQQIGCAGQRLPLPLVAIVTDSGFNRLQGVPVTFRVVRGEGLLDNASTEKVVLTDSDGRASALFELGAEEGNANNLVRASFSDAEDAPLASYVASARTAGDPAQTSVSGLVLDNTDQPVPGVTVTLVGTGLSAQTDAAGSFQISGAPVGTFHLDVDGATAQRPGTWPHLEFVITTIAGRDNTLGRPIYVLPLDVDSGIFVSETEGGILTLPSYPGFALEIEPGSVTFPDGSHSGTVSVTPVHGDKVPMVPNFGQQPRFIITIQPGGAKFDPPARMTLPNVDGLAPGEVTELYSFDHDLGSFVSIGPGTVNAEGSSVVSNLGVGVIEAGWHCGGNPAAAGTPHDCPDCQRCVRDNCVADPGQDGSQCEGDICRECQGGSCGTTSTRVEIQQPPDNPNPQDATFDTNFSFLSTTEIVSNAALTGAGDSSRIQWMVTAGLGGVKDENPTNRMGPTFRFTPNPPAHPMYKMGGGCSSPGNGSCDRSAPLNYSLQASYCSSSDRHNIAQDQIDIIRQEYFNHALDVPGRDDFRIPIDTGNFSVGEIIGNNSYSVVLGDPGGLAQAIRDRWNELIQDDVQVVPVGTDGLQPFDVVVAPGEEINRIGAILETTPCNGLPIPQTCDDQMIDGFIVAGINGIAETVAFNTVAENNFGLWLSSGWRNPERNEAIGGVQRSRHQSGDAVDLVPTRVAGKTLEQLYCILETAAQDVADRNRTFAEDESTRSTECDTDQSDTDTRPDHVHAQR